LKNAGNQTVTEAIDFHSGGKSVVFNSWKKLIQVLSNRRAS